MADTHVLVNDGEGKAFRVVGDHVMVDGVKLTREDARKLWVALKKEGWMEP